jgi:hypothetical protein
MEINNAVINVEYQHRNFIYTDRHTDTQTRRHTHTQAIYFFPLSDRWQSTCKLSACCWPPITITLSSSHCCCPIAVVQMPLSNCHPQIAAIVVIDIFAVGGGGSIITVAVAVAITIGAIAISAIAVVAVIVDVASSTLLHHCLHCHAPWWPIGEIGQNQATAASPMACGRSDYLWVDYRGGEGVARTTLCP